MTNADNEDDLALFTNTPAKVESLLYNLQQAAGGIGLFMKANKIECINFKQKGAISTKWQAFEISRPVHNISSTENDVYIHLAKMWNAINKLLIIWKSDLSK